MKFWILFLKILFLIEISRANQLLPPPLPSVEPGNQSSQSRFFGGYGGSSQALPFGMPAGSVIGSNSFSGNFPNYQNQDRIPPSTALIGDTQFCPFRKDQSDIASDAISGVINSLQSLASKCPAIKNSALNLERQAQHLNSISQGLNSNQGRVDLNCNNYPHVLEREYRLVIKNKNYISKIQRYSECTAESKECLEEKYFSSLGDFADSCRMANDLTKKDTVKQSLEQLVTQTEALLDQSSKCDKVEGYTSAMTSVGINSLTTLAALAPGAGIAGSIIGLSGRLLSSLSDKFFSEGSPNEGISDLKDEQEFADLACLYYTLQNRTLNCQKQAPLNFSKPSNSKLCDLGHDSNLDDIAKLFQKVSNLQNEQPVKEMVSILNSEIQDPNEGPQAKQTMMDLLLKASGPKEKESGLPRLNNFGPIPLDAGPRDPQLHSLLQRIRRHSENTKGLPPTDADKRHALFEKTLSDKDRILLSRSPDIISKYWEGQSGGTDYFATLKRKSGNSEAKIAGYQIALASAKNSELSEEDAYQRQLNIAVNYMTRNFRSQFEGQLENLDKTARNNFSKQDLNGKISDLMPILRICSLTGSMFYANPQRDMKNDWALMQMTGKPVASYDKICSQFQCSEASKSPISPFQINKDDPFGTMRIAQCSAVDSQKKSQDQLVKNLREFGKPCP